MIVVLVWFGQAGTIDATGKSVQLAIDKNQAIFLIPALCRKKDLPHCIITLQTGKLMHKRTASHVAVTAVRKEDSSVLERLLHFPGAAKSKHVMERRERALQKELEKKIGLQLT